MRKKSKVQGIIYAALSAIAFALTPTICKFAYKYDWTGTSLTAIAVLMASAMIFIYTRIKKIPIRLNKDEIRPVILAAVFNCIGIVAYNQAAGMIPGGSTTALNYLYPALILITSALFFSFRLTVLRVFSAVLNVAGVLFFFEKSGNMLLGCLIAIASAVFYGAYSMVVEHSSLAKTNTFKLAFYITFLSALFGVILGLLTNQMSLPKEGGAYLWAFALGFVANVLGIVFFQSALQNIGAAQASLTATLEPLTSIILGALIFSEGITWKTGIGCILIMAGIALNAISTIKEDAYARTDENAYVKNGENAYVKNGENAYVKTENESDNDIQISSKQEVE